MAIRDESERSTARGRLQSAGLRGLASSRLTIAGFIALGAAVIGTYVSQSIPAWSVALALGVLAVNLTASLIVLPPLRHGGLGIFHVALLCCLLLVAYGRLTHFSGRVVIADGQVFEPEMVEVDSRGVWHRDGYRELKFTQGTFTVSYAPGVRREHTRSQVVVGDGAGATPVTVGDDQPLMLDGYRFYTTSNKGFAPILTWIGADRRPVTGAVVLPSYPLNDWQQEQRWTAPDGVEWRFWLRQSRPVDETNPWLLDPRRTEALMIAERAGERFELRPGEEAAGAFGRLRYEWLTGWMGYKVFYDPTLVPLLVLSVVGVLGMAWHLGTTPGRRGRRAPGPADRPAREGSVLVAQSRSR